MNFQLIPHPHDLGHEIGINFFAPKNHFHFLVIPFGDFSSYPVIRVPTTK
jgi:hypothetical protein